MASQFFVTCRLKPTVAFEEFDGLPVNFGDGYELDFKKDLAWVTFEASREDWERKREEGLSRLRTYLSAVTLQKEYPFEIEPIQWIEVAGEPRGTESVLGRLEPSELVAQEKPPKVTTEDFDRAREYVIIAEMSPFFRIAMLDYSVALSFPREAVVFLARSLDAVEGHFRVNPTVPASMGKPQKVRDVMRTALCLSNRELNRFHTIANETTLARHAKKLSQLRAPTLNELRFCVVFCRQVLERFAPYLWYENRDTLKEVMPFPENVNPADEFMRGNESLQELLRDILSGKLE